MFPVKVFALHASVYTGSGVGVHMTSLCICVCRTQEQVETQWEPKETKEMWEYLENQEHPVRPQKKNDPSDDSYWLAHLTLRYKQQQKTAETCIIDVVLCFS